MASRGTMKLTVGTERDRPVVFVHAGYDPDVAMQIRKFAGSRWSDRGKCWVIPGTQFDLRLFFERISPLAYIDYSDLNSKTKFFHPVRKAVPEILLPEGYLKKLENKRYSENTIKTYCYYFRDFLSYFAGRNIEQITYEEISQYILKLIQEKGISASQQNQRINCIKFYYEKVLGREKNYFELERPRRERKLPDVLSKEEVLMLLKATQNLKHKCILSLIYSAGLRRSELINLQVNDVDSKRMLLKIRGAKGKKDRYSILSHVLIHELREYYKEYRPDKWLFEGVKGEQYSATSIQKIIKHSAAKAGIRKRVHVHMLRHSFATHLLDQGTSIKLIQELLGHESIKTTEIYTHVSTVDFKKIVNPLDNLFSDTT